jgi:hypothetical protein
VQGREFGETCYALEFGHFTGTEARVPLTRAEGPRVNSPARQGGGLEDPESEVRRTGTRTVPHLSALMVVRPDFPGLTAGATHCRPYGPGEACFAGRDLSLHTQSNQEYVAVSMKSRT